MRKFFDSFTWLFLLAFLIPSTLIVASWNSLPGDSIYGIKLTLERSLLVLVSPSYIAKGTLEMKYTERRFNETKRLLASKQSVEGLPYLNAQVASTKAVIEQAPDSKVQAQLAKSYIDTLTSVSSQLEEQKRSLESSSAPVSASVTPTRKASVSNLPPTTPKTTPPAAAVAGQKPVSTTLPMPTVMVTNAPSVPPASAITPPIQVAVTEIAQTQEAIAAAINDLQQVAREAEKEEKKQEKSDRQEDRQDGSPDGNEHGGREDNQRRGRD